MAKSDDLKGLLWNKNLEEWQEVIQTDLEESLQGKKFYFVTELNGQIIGQVVVSMKAENGLPYISALRVKDAYQNKGIGTNLIQHAEQVLQTNGASRVHIAVEISNTAALRLYKRLGYQQVGQERQEHWTRTYQGKTIKDDVILFDLEKRL